MRRPLCYRPNMMIYAGNPFQLTYERWRTLQLLGVFTDANTLMLSRI